MFQKVPCGVHQCRGPSMVSIYHICPGYTLLTSLNPPCSPRTSEAASVNNDESLSIRIDEHFLYVAHIIIDDLDLLLAEITSHQTGPNTTSKFGPFKFVCKNTIFIKFDQNSEEQETSSGSGGGYRTNVFEVTAGQE